MKYLNGHKNGLHFVFFSNSMGERICAGLFQMTFVSAVFFRAIMVGIILLGICFKVTAQNNNNPELQLPNVYLDCGDCDDRMLKRTIQFVNYVRDRLQADIHILVTDQNTGGGGESYRINFIGKNGFDNINYTIRYQVPVTATELEVDQGMVEKIKSGLVPFMSQTSWGDALEINLGTSTSFGQGNGQAKKDPWNHWVFEIEGNIYQESEERQQEISLNGEISADRVTEMWRVRNEIYWDYEREEYETDEGTILSINQEYEYQGSVVRSLNNHWSIGLFGAIFSNSYENRALSAKLMPAMEWNFFPYQLSDRKELTVAYRLGGRYNDYMDSTIYNKSREQLMEQSIDISFDMRQPWGNLELNLEGSNYLMNIQQNRLEFESDISIRLIKGLALNVGGGVSLIHDQRHLPKGDATKEDILLQRRELTTSYQYDFYMGVSYTFGSIYNNIVNSRL